MPTPGIVPEEMLDRDDRGEVNLGKGQSAATAWNGITEAFGNSTARPGAQEGMTPVSATMQRIAIVLHGPPATGKTRIAEEILGRLKGRARVISLDEGWDEPTEERYPEGEGRYADLKDVEEEILVIELALGEPPHLEFKGATRGAEEWVLLLKTQGRTIHAYHLEVDWATAIERLDARRVERNYSIFHFDHEVGMHALSRESYPSVTLPGLPELEERKIDTSKGDYGVIADHILRECGVAKKDP